MSCCSRQFALSVMAIAVPCYVGCSSKPAAPPAQTATEHEPAHVSAGPHGGSLIELGEEEYHAELIHDDAAKTVTVYLLDGKATAGVPIEAAEIVINLKHEGRGEQFKLAASPDAGDPPGKSSRFSSNEAELAEDLDREGAEARLAISINGKPFQAAVEHHH